MDYKRAEALRMVVSDYPLEKRGPVRGHDVFEALAIDKLVVKDACGRWIPTAAGVYAHQENVIKGTVEP